MSKEDIRILLKNAMNAKRQRAGMEVNRIQLLLTASIRGNDLDRLNEVETLYVEWIDTNPSFVPESLVDELFSLL